MFGLITAVHFTCFNYFYNILHRTLPRSVSLSPFLTCRAILPTSFEAMTGSIAFIDSLLAEVLITAREITPGDAALR